MSVWVWAYVRECVCVSVCACVSVWVWACVIECVRVCVCVWNVVVSLLCCEVLSVLYCIVLYYIVATISADISLTSQQNTKIIFPYWKTCCQNNLNESISDSQICFKKNKKSRV